MKYETQIVTIRYSAMPALSKVRTLHVRMSKRRGLPLSTKQNGYLQRADKAGLEQGQRARDIDTQPR